MKSYAERIRTAGGKSDVPCKDSSSSQEAYDKAFGKGKYAKKEESTDEHAKRTN